MIHGTARGILLAAALLPAALFPPPSAAAGDPEGPPIPEEIRARIEEARRVTVGRLRGFGDWCSRNGFRRTARDAWERALRYDPEDHLVRRKLGWRRSGESWVRDPGDGAPASDDAPAGRTADRDRRRGEAESPCAAAWEAVARLCRDAGLPDAEAAAWRSVLEFAPDHAEARTACGYRLVEGRWRSEAQILHGEFVAEMAALLAEVRAEEGRQKIRSEVPGPDRAKAAGVPLTAWSSRLYTVESNFPGTGCVDLLRTVERVDLLLGRLFGPVVPERARQGRNFLVLEAHEPYRRAIEGLHAGTPTAAAAKARLGGCDVPGGVHVAWRPQLEAACDAIGHRAGERFLGNRFPGARPRAWLHEGFAYLGTGTVLGTTRTWCVRTEASSVARDPFLEFPRWPAAVREMVERGEDPPLTLVVRMEMNSHTRQTVAKSWSVLLWLLETRREGLVAFLEKVGEGEARTEEEAARSAFGMDLDELDHRWREWVREVL